MSVLTVCVLGRVSITQPEEQPAGFALTVSLLPVSLWGRVGVSFSGGWNLSPKCLSIALHYCL